MDWRLSSWAKHEIYSSSKTIWAAESPFLRNLKVQNADVRQDYWTLFILVHVLLWRVWQINFVLLHAESSSGWSSTACTLSPSSQPNLCSSDFQLYICALTQTTTMCSHMSVCKFKIEVRTKAWDEGVHKHFMFRLYADTCTHLSYDKHLNAHIPSIYLIQR